MPSPTPPGGPHPSAGSCVLVTGGSPSSGTPAHLHGGFITDVLQKQRKEACPVTLSSPQGMRGYFHPFPSPGANLDSLCILVFLLRRLARLGYLFPFLLEDAMDAWPSIMAREPTPLLWSTGMILSGFPRTSHPPTLHKAVLLWPHVRGRLQCLTVSDTEGWSPGQNHRSEGFSGR